MLVEVPGTVYKAFFLTEPSVSQTLTKWFNKHIMAQIKKKSFVQKNGLIAVWSMAGFMAMGYIGFLAVGSNGSPTSNPQLAQAGGTTLKVNPVEQQLAALNENMKKLASKTESTSREISILKEAFNPTAALPDSPRKQPQAQAQNEANRADNVKTAKVSVSVLPLTENDSIDLLSGLDAGESYGVDVAQGLSIATLERYWKKQQGNALFSGLTPHYINRSSDDQVMYSLVLGPFQLKSAARKLCQQLGELSMECETTHYRAGPSEKIQTAGK